jgi:spermidine/putrescine ABC transporter ATP-binding subunit
MPDHAMPPQPATTVRGLDVRFCQVSRLYGATAAVDAVDLDVRAGEFLSLVGPSGSGKTTLLMLLAGFDEPSAGRILVGGRDITRVPPNKRDIALVFQRYALFPHKTVFDNVAFSLRMRGVGRLEREERVRRALAMVKLDAFGQRYPGQLSGGQQQRVALARAIVFDPPVILMDEPLGALDKKLRQHMQVEIKELQARLGATVVYVTHDQEEALTMSDRIAVLDRGRMQQVGSPRALYQKPENAFVAEFIGEMSFFRGAVLSVDGQACAVRTGAGIAAGHAPASFVPASGQAVRIGVRPEHVLLSVGQGLAGRIVHQIFSGDRVTAIVALDSGEDVRVQLPVAAPEAALPAGHRVAISWPSEHAHVFPESA